MESQVFISLAVEDLNKSLDFYTSLGFTVNPQFSDDTTKCMIWSPTIFVMIMTHEKFKSFGTKPIADTKNTVGVGFSLSMESLDKVNQAADNGLAAGGAEPSPFEDYGFMQRRSVEDFDGHIWDFFYMDMSKFPGA